MFKVLDHFVKFERFVNVKKDNIMELLTSHSQDPLIQIFATDSIAGNRQILHSVYISLLAFKRKVNFAKNLQLEILLTLAQVRQIKKAIELMSPKKSDMIILATGTNEKKVLDVFEEAVKILNGEKREITPIQKDSKHASEITSNKIYSKEELICENMALIELLR